MPQNQINQNNIWYGLYWVLSFTRLIWTILPKYFYWCEEVTFRLNLWTVPSMKWTYFTTNYDAPLGPLSSSLLAEPSIWDHISQQKCHQWAHSAIQSDCKGTASAVFISLPLSPPSITATTSPANPWPSGWTPIFHNLTGCTHMETAQGGILWMSPHGWIYSTKYHYGCIGTDSMSQWATRPISEWSPVIFRWSIEGTDLFSSSLSIPASATW